MSAELRALLDGLDAAREKATPGPWATDEAHGRDICDEAYSWHAVVQPNGDEVATTWPVGHERHDPAADAALIVAAVNALPKFTAALRQVAAIADVWDGIADMWTESAEHPSAAPGPREMARGEAFDFRERARVLRAALAAALTPEQADR